MTKDKKTIVTHSGGFHTDDVFTVTTLLMLHPDAEVIRTRNPKLFKTGDYVVDVGGEYDPDINRFDHHQEGGAGKRENGIPYATFGLVWKKFGETVCKSKEVADVIDRKLVAPVDAFDNGVDVCDTKILGVHPYRIEQVFFALEPTWQEKSERSTDEGFKEALGIARYMLDREIVHTTAEINAQKIIKDTYNRTKDKRLIVFDDTHIFDRGLLTDAFVEHKDVIYIVRKHEGGLWQVAAAVDDAHSFDKRKPLPSAWAGKRDEELAKITGVEDAIFCHNQRFMCIVRSQEGAVKLAQIALEL